MVKSFYLAGKVLGNDAIGVLKEFSEELERRGHTNICPWWDMKDVTKPYLEHIKENAPLAVEMLRAATAAEIFALFAHPELLGASTEFGMALASSEVELDKRIYVIGAMATRQSVFYTHPRVENVISHTELRDAEWY
ncbi:MAG TPA: hypothetical protein VMR76_02015 [Candidatus Saccharimonadia bacterium]|nr:hypothetical protein [Candidatus Saccharimonadia bacterium]